MVNIPAEVKHWHGTAADRWFSHLAVEVPAEGANEWLEAVTDEARIFCNAQIHWWGGNPGASMQNSSFPQWCILNKWIINLKFIGE